MIAERSSIENLLSSYPRARPPISDEQREVYVREYRLNRSGRGALYGATRWLESWMHRRVAAGQSRGSLLELGAGSLNHVPYEDPDIPYDCVEPFVELYKDSPFRARIRSIYADVREVPAMEKYGRVCSVAVLEHLTDLPGIVAVSALCLSDEGIFQAGIPTEGGVLWGLAWRLTTGVSYRLRTGLRYGPLMRHEHVNSADEIEAVVRHFFRDVRVIRFPLPAFHLSFYTYIEARNPRRDVCRLYIEEA